MKTRERLKVCLITSGHARYDTRIFRKECISLRNRGYEVTLIVNDELENEVKDGINIISTKFKPRNRCERLFMSKRKIKEVLNDVDAEIIHLHDSELLQLVKYLKSIGKTVIFDSHEDYLHAIDDKKWIPKYFKKIASLIYKIYEKNIISKVDGAIVCYHWTEERFKKYCKNVKMVLNFPIIQNDIKFVKKSITNRNIGFAGLISEIWCHDKVIDACNQIGNINYELAGRLTGPYGEYLKLLNGWNAVNYHGQIPSTEVYEKVYAKSSIGIALLDYISLCNGNVGNLSNTKIFEIMYSGLPLICTDFKLWKEIVENEKCGICVNPHNQEEIIDAITTIISDPELAAEMGKNGIKAVEEKYNWNLCEKELFLVYDYIIKEKYHND